MSDETISSDDPWITVSETGPYLVAGDLPLVAKEPIYSESGEPMTWRAPEPIDHRTRYALCRCGESGNKPFCDGSHAKADWDPSVKPPDKTYAEASTSLGGTGIEIRDDRPLCVHAGFCGNEVTTVWKLAGETGDSRVRMQVISMVENCPSGALTYLIDGTTNEPELAQEISVIADGPLWVQAGTPVTLPDESQLEQRNRVALCRCGHSGQKPLCDGTHKEIGFKG